MTIPKSVLLIIYSTNDNTRSLMKLTSLLLVETLSNSDYIMVYDYGANGSCAEHIVPAKSSQKQFIQHCVVAELSVTDNVSLSAAYEKFNR